MQNIDPTLLQELLQNNSDGSEPAISLFPKSFINLLNMSLIALTIISVLFLVVYTIGTIRRWKVRSAVLAMQKDMREIKESLASNTTPKSE